MAKFVNSLVVKDKLVVKGEAIGVGVGVDPTIIHRSDDGSVSVNDGGMAVYHDGDVDVGKNLDVGGNLIVNSANNLVDPEGVAIIDRYETHIIVYNDTLTLSLVVFTKTNPMVNMTSSKLVAWLKDYIKATTSADPSHKYLSVTGAVTSGGTTNTIVGLGDNAYGGLAVFTTTRTISTFSAINGFYYTQIIH